MTTKQMKRYKEEFTKRYKYLYENASFILAPYMYQEDKKDPDIESMIYLRSLDIKTLSLLEEILLTNSSMEETKFYRNIESYKQDRFYLDFVKAGALLLKQYNDGIENDIAKIKLDFWCLLAQVRDYISKQTGDVSNRNQKLEVLDEYFRMDRYSNDGKVWTSGFELTFHDLENGNNFLGSIIPNLYLQPRDKNDIGITNNAFINCFSNTSIVPNRNNSVYFTEEEKQKVYLEFHDELPYRLLINCQENSFKVDEFVLKKEQKDCSPCGNAFDIDEMEIFYEKEFFMGKEYYLFYQLCPKCGYMVRIPEEILGKSSKKRIIRRCDLDPNLSTKMELYSRLKALDNKSLSYQKKMLK